MVRDLHSAPKVDRIGEAIGGGVRFLLVRLQYGKADIAYALHANPEAFTLSGVQTADYLQNLGFEVSACGFFGHRCLAREVAENSDPAAFAAAFDNGWGAYKSASDHLRACGLISRGDQDRHGYRDGHTATKSNKLKESTDDGFSFVLTRMDNNDEKGWTFHYRPKHPPMSPELEAALSLIGGFRTFGECPQFDFEPCYWRFIEKVDHGDSIWDERAGFVHSQFDAHATRFSAGVQLLLAAHSAMQPFGLSLLKVPSQEQPETQPITTRRGAGRSVAPNPRSHLYDVAISFAGPERSLAHELARRLQASGIVTFYDEFYPEQLWGKDLATLFDRIYRKDSRFCVIFASKAYTQREWTHHERRSAVARAVAERGREYILPIQVEPVELDGIPPTIGYLSLNDFSIERIADLLVKKLATG
jgi:hypothetical protein